MKTYAIGLLLFAGLVLAIVALPARARHAPSAVTPVPVVAPTPHPSPDPEPMVDVEHWCDAACRKIVTSPPGVSHVLCWSCCLETCMCHGGVEKRCGEAKAACAPEFLQACPDIAKRAPTPPK